MAILQPEEINNLYSNLGKMVFTKIPNVEYWTKTINLPDITFRKT